MDAPSIIMGTIGLTSAWIAYNAVWCGALKTMFRQNLFKLRDSLFIDAARKNISFDDPAYVMLRRMIERTLAASEDFNVVQVAAAVYLTHRRSRSRLPVHDEFQRLMADMPDRSRADIYKKYHEQLLQVIAAHFVRTLPIPIVGAVLVYLLYRAPGMMGRELIERVEAARKPAADNYVDAAYYHLAA